jgi:hypothetical protein
MKRTSTRTRLNPTSQPKNEEIMNRRDVGARNSSHGLTSKLAQGLFAAAYLLTALAHGQTWTQLGPTARYGHTAVFDPVTAKMIVLGGVDSTGPYNDAWASTTFQSSSHNLQWTQVIGSSLQHPSRWARGGFSPRQS